MKPAVLFPSLALAGSVLAWVELDPSIIPHVEEPLPVFTLGPPASLPIDFLNQLIQEANPGVTLQPNQTVGPGLFAYDGDRLVAYVDETGEAQIFPDIAALNSTNEVDYIDTERVWGFLSVNGSFPLDDTNVTVTMGESLYGTTAFTQDQNSSFAAAAFDLTPEIYWTNGVVERTVIYNNVTYPVCGPGSQATFSISPEGSVVSLAYNWRPASRTNQTITANATAVAVESIKAQLEPIGFKSGLVKVNKVEVCFYDSGVSAMQPVYRYFGYSHADRNSTVTVPTPITGYIVIGSGSPEFIPALNEIVTTNPPAESNNSTLAARAPPNYFEARREIQRRGPKPRVKVARYVVRDDVAQWTKSANNFWNNLSDKVADFTNDQFYWSWPYLYTTRKERFINDANIALTEAHGSYHLFSTEKNCCDLVDIDTDIPSGVGNGYGGGASTSGDLAYWIIHSCEVLPTPADYSAADRREAYAPWWDVFNGMHAVLSYRTQMFIADNAAGATAKAISRGAPVVSAWMKAVNEDKQYRGGPTYFSTNANREQPYGRASAIFVCGHESDRVWQVENLGRPDCLRTLWYDN